MTKLLDGWWVWLLHLRQFYRGFAVTPSFPGAPSLRLVIMRLPLVSKAGFNNSEHSFGGGMCIHKSTAWSGILDANVVPTLTKELSTFATVFGSEVMSFLDMNLSQMLSFLFLFMTRIIILQVSLRLVLFSINCPWLNRFPAILNKALQQYLYTVLLWVIGCFCEKLVWFLIHSSDLQWAEVVYFHTVSWLWWSELHGHIHFRICQWSAHSKFHYLHTHS